MSRTYQAVLMIMVGAALGSIAVDGRYLNYLKPAMHIPLLLGALVFLGIGIAELVALRRSAPAVEETPCGEGGHHHFPRSGWLLVLPVLAIGFVAPPALGSWAAERDSGPSRSPAPATFPRSHRSTRSRWPSASTACAQSGTTARP